MARAFVFDADGVVIVGPHAGDAFASEYGITRDMTRPFFQGDFVDCLVGRSDLKEVLPAYFIELGLAGLR